MSSIDQYKHRTLGFIECPCTLPLVYNAGLEYVSPTRITVYQLSESIPDDEKDFDGKKGDILVGGGSGEAPSLRISNPLAFQFFAWDAEESENEPEFNELSAIYKAYWTPTQAYIIGEGFQKLGWSPEEIELDMWIAENVCTLLSQELPEFEQFKAKSGSKKSSLKLLK